MTPQVDWVEGLAKVESGLEVDGEEVAHIWLEADGWRIHLKHARAIVAGPARSRAEAMAVTERILSLHYGAITKTLQQRSESRR